MKLGLGLDLSGQGRKGVDGPPPPIVPEFALVSSAEDDAGNTASSTFLTQALGTPDTNRVLYTVVMGRGALAAPTGAAPTVTLGGVAMTLIGEAFDSVGSAQRRVALYTIAQADLADPNAESATIVVTYGVEQHRGKAIFTYRGVGYAQAASDTLAVTVAADPMTGSLDATDGGVCIAGLMLDNASAVAWTAPLAQDGSFDVLFNGHKCSAASADELTAGALTVTGDPGTAPTAVSALFAATFALI